MESGGSTCWAKSSPTPTVLIVKWRDIGSDQVCTRTKASLLEKQTRRQQQSQIWAISMMKRRTVWTYISKLIWKVYEDNKHIVRGELIDGQWVQRMAKRSCAERKKMEHRMAQQKKTNMEHAQYWLEPFSFWEQLQNQNQLKQIPKEHSSMQWPLSLDQELNRRRSSAPHYEAQKQKLHSRRTKTQIRSISLGPDKESTNKVKRKRRTNNSPSRFISQ